MTPSHRLCLIAVGPDRLGLALVPLLALAPGCMHPVAASAAKAVTWDSSLFFSAPRDAQQTEDRSALVAQLQATWDDSFELTNGQRAVEVSSCQQLLALDASYEPKPPEMPLYLDRRALCRATQIVVGAQASKASFWNGFALDEKAPSILPAAFALAISPDDEQKLAQASARKEPWSQVESVQLIARHSPSTTSYRADGAVQDLTLLARGDFDRDGTEDLLFSSRAHVTEGSYRTTRLLANTRQRADQAVATLIPVH